LRAAPVLGADGAGVADPGHTAALTGATTPEAASAPPQGKESSHENRVETRIKDLHRKLKITAAQESQWNGFAQVMRENAQEVDAVLKERAESLHKMNAVEDLHSYEELADAHADGLKKLVPAFETLYNTMSEDQKKTADAVFAEHEKRPHEHGSSK
jgi:hypothetical protein